MSSPQSGATYESAGVNLEASQRVKERIKEVAKKTYGPNVLGGVGGFGAMYKVMDTKILYLFRVQIQ